MRLGPFVIGRRAGDAPAAAPRPRRGRRAGAPRTIVPVLDPAAPGEPLSLERLDQARARLREAIPPRADDE